MPLGMIAATMVAFWLNDFTGHVSLNRTMAGLAQVAVLLFMLFMLFFSIELDKYFLILTMGKLLVYWQMIILFQKKEIRTYWHQVQLSLLQVVVAALLMQGFFFGLLLIVYLFTALCALTLMFLYEERNRHHSAEKVVPPPATDGALAVGPAGTLVLRPGGGPFGSRPGAFRTDVEDRLHLAPAGDPRVLVDPSFQSRGVARAGRWRSRFRGFRR